jgi:hypothetical protein
MNYHPGLVLLLTFSNESRSPNSISGCRAGVADVWFVGGGSPWPASSVTDYDR